MHCHDHLTCIASGSDDRRILVAVHYLVGDDRLVNLAIISYMSAPATFSMQTFMKDEEGSAYVSTTNSMYCLVSILVYIIMAVTIY